MNKILKRFVSLILTVAITAGALPLTAFAADDDNEIYTLSNEFIKVEVSGKNGGFHIDTVAGDKLEKDDDNKMLLHNSSEYDTSFTSFRITADGKSKDYIFGRSYGFLGLSGTDIKTVKSDSRITSVWTVEGIEITQNIELANSSSAENGMVIISYTAKNSAGKKADNVSARIMLDTALGYQDYAYYKIPDNGTYITVENEHIVDGSTVGHMMFGYDDENKPKITAYTVNASVDNEECVPEKVAFGHWNNLAATVYDFEPNKDLTFTNPYNAQYLTADSAYALYFDMGALDVGSESTCATNYGVYSNAGVGRDAKLAINISGSNPLTLNADKTAYVSANAGDKEGELTLGASIKNFAADSFADLKNVKVAVYPDSMMIPIDENGSTTNANGEQYGTQALYSVDYNSIAAGQTMNTDFKFKALTAANATYRKIEFVAYQTDENSSVLTDKNIIGRQSVYILCPGTDNGIPEVVLTGCTEYIYYSGKQRISATGINMIMLTNKSDYNFALKQITENGYGETITIDSENAVVDTDNNTIDLTVPEVKDENTGNYKKWPLGTYQLVIDYKDEAKKDVVSSAAKVIVTDDAKYANFGYGIITVEQIHPENEDKNTKPRYEVKTYLTEKDYKKYIEDNTKEVGTGKDAKKVEPEILVELKGDFSAERYDEDDKEKKNPYYEADVITSRGVAQNPVLLNSSMELHSGYIKVTVQNKGDEEKQSILVDIDGDMRMAGTGTVIYDGSAALTAIENGTDYDLRRYTKDGIRCDSLGDNDKRQQNMAEGINYIFAKDFERFVSLANVVNADLTFGELGVMVDDDCRELTKLVSFSAMLDLGFLIPKGSKEYKQKFSSAWTSYFNGVKKAAKDTLGKAMATDQIKISSAYLRREWNTFKNNETVKEQAARKSSAMSQATAEVEDILFGGGQFIGINFSVEIGVPPLSKAMPPISGKLSVNTIGNWRFGVEGSADFKGMSVEAKIEIIYSDKLKAPFPNELYLYIEFPPPGLNVDGFLITYLRGGGGGIKNLYEVVYTPNSIPSTSIILSVGASILQVIMMKINLEMSLTGISLEAERGTLSETDVTVLRNSGIRFQWAPSFKFTGNVNVDFLGILRGSGYIVVDPSNASYEFYAMVALMLPSILPLIGGVTIGSVGVGINQDKIWGKVKVIGLQFGILYYWGGDFSFNSGNNKAMEPSYPELLSADDVAVGYDEETGRTLYAHVVPNFAMLKSTAAGDSVMTMSEDYSDISLYSNANKTEHKLNLGAYKSDSGALNIMYDASSKDEAYKLANEIAITDASGNAYTLNILKDDESNADTANAFVVYEEPEKEGEKGKARFVVSFTEKDSFNKDWNIKTAAASVLEIYNVSSLPEFAMTESKISGNKAELKWDIKSGTNACLDKISVYAAKDSEPISEGTLIGIIEDKTTLESGSAALDIPMDLASGEYYIRAVATMNETLTDTAVSDKKYTFTNSNQPVAASEVTAANAGDYRLRVSAKEDGTCDGYVVNLYEVSKENGKTVYKELENVSGATFSAGEDIIVGGRYERKAEDTEETTEEKTEYIGLEAGKTYAAGLRRINYIKDSEGNTVAGVMSEETLSEGVLVNEPKTPEIKATVTDGEGNIAVDLPVGTVAGQSVTAPTVKTGNVVISFESDMPVSGTWYLDNTSFEAAQESGKGFGIFASKDNTFVISLDNLDTQEHILRLDGTNSVGDGFSKTVTFKVDDIAPVLVLNSPTAGSVAADDKVTITGRTDADAKLKVEVNGTVIGEKIPPVWDADSKDGSFSITVPTDKSLMKNKITVTATDAVGNTTQKTVRVVNSRMTNLEKVKIYLGENDITGILNDTSNDMSGKLALFGVSKSGEEFRINDSSMTEWNTFAVDGNISYNEESDTLFVKKGSNGMLTGMLRLTEYAVMSAAAAFGESNLHQILFSASENGVITVNPTSAKQGETVSISVVPNDGYIFKGWKSNDVTFADSSLPSTTFTMPDSDVSLSAIIERAEFTPDVVLEYNSTGYDGTEKRPSVTVKDGTKVIPDSYYDVAYADNTNAGTATVKVTLKDKYTGSALANFEIKKKTPAKDDFDITLPESKVYDGNERTASVSLKTPYTDCGAVTVYYTGTGKTQYAKTKEAPTLPGSYKVTFDVAGGQNFNSVQGLEAGSFTIERKTAQKEDFVFTAPENLVYSGTAKVAAAKLEGSKNITLKYYKDGAETEPKNVGTYTVKATCAESTYYGAVSEMEIGEFTINPLPIEIAWDGTENLIYDGKAKTITARVANAVDGDTVNITVSGNSGTEKGTYTATVTAVDNTNYTLENGINTTKEWVIAAGTNEITSLALDGWTYGDTANEPKASAKFGTPTFTYSDKENGAYSEEVPTDAGTYFVKATVQGTENYAEAFKTAEFTIAEKVPVKDDFDITLPESKIYDGTKRAASVSLKQNYTNCGEIIVYYEAEGGSKTTEVPVLPGNYKVTFDVAGGQNFNSAQGLEAGSFTIGRKTAQREDFVFTAPENLVYSGTAKAATAKLEGADDITLKYYKEGIEAEPKNVGTYAVKATCAESTYYGAVEEQEIGTFAINPLPIEIAWDGTENLIYDGEIKTVTARVANAVAGDTVNITVSGNSGTEQGTYAATVTAVDNPNYTLIGGLDIRKEWAIAAGTNEITSLALDGWTYGDKTNEPTATAKFGIPTFTYSDKEDGAYSEEVPTDAGTYFVKATVQGTENYAEASKTLQFTIAPKTFAGTVEDIGEQIYNGAEITPELTVKDGETTLLKDIDYTAEYVSNKTAGTAKVIITFKGNYAGSIEKEYTIAKADPSISAMPLAGKIKRGSKLSESALTNGSAVGVDGAELKGTFAWKDGSEVMNTNGSFKKLVIFTPEDTNYKPYEFEVEVTVYSSSSGGGSIGTTPSYRISVTQTNGGKISPDTVSVSKGNSQKFTVTPDDGYEISDVSVDGKSIGVVTSYTFEKITAAHTITAVFKKVNEGNNEKDPSEVTWKNPFTDIKETDWFYDAVKYVNENGLMKGISDTEFAPENNITRAMFVTVLYRIENEPQTIASAFNDIESGSYYEKAVAWANANGIVLGVSEDRFAPNDNITREQMAAIIYRYAAFKGYDMTANGNTNYKDNDDISDYAKSAVIWASEKAVMTGNTDGSFAPKANTTRAQAAAVFMRVLENLK